MLDSNEDVFWEDYVEDKEVYNIEIPAISLKESLCNLDREVCLERGVWLKSFDLYEGNFLLTGHSFFIYPFKAGVFYRLDEVSIGDYVYLYFDEEVYVYEVITVSIHDRYDIEVEDFEDDFETLKIYTCYPAWSNLKRLVVVARRVGQ